MITSQPCAPVGRQLQRCDGGTELSKHFLSITPPRLMKCGCQLTSEDPESLSVLCKTTCLVFGIQPE